MNPQTTTPPPPTTTTPPSTTTQPPLKLRLMCSYGGNILPRPHDKTLTYIGGHTRLITVDRNTTLPNLITRLIKTLTNNNNNKSSNHSLNGTTTFRIKYLLPSEDLDSLISVTNEEDLENMIDEYDRLNSVKRLRLFLFPEKAEEFVSGCYSLLEDSGKSEEWFVNVLNGGSSGFFNTDTNGSLLGFHDEVNVLTEAVTEKEEKVVQDVLSVLESLVIETTSSDGSGNGDDQEKAKVISGVLQQKVGCGFDISSPDSVSSDGVMKTLSRRQPAVIYQEPVNNNNMHDQKARVQLQQLSQVDPQHPQNHQPQFIRTTVPPPQYIRHLSGAVPMASYYPMYTPQSQHHLPLLGLDQRNFVYYMPAAPIGYNLPLQGDATAVVSAPPNSQVSTPSSLFTTPQTVKTAEPVTKPESPACRTNDFGASGPQLVQVPSSQHQLQPQYVAYSQIQQPSQTVASSGGGNYALQQGQHIYYAAQRMPPQSAAQHQMMTSALPVEAGDLQTDNSMKQQVKTSES